MVHLRPGAVRKDMGVETRRAERARGVPGAARVRVEVPAADSGLRTGSGRGGCSGWPLGSVPRVAAEDGGRGVKLDGRAHQPVLVV